MRISLRKLAQIERFLTGKYPPKEQQQLQTRLHQDPAWAEQVADQQQAYQIICLYGRQKLKAEIQQVDNQLFSNPKHAAFQQRMRDLFQK